MVVGAARGDKKHGEVSWGWSVAIVKDWRGGCGLRIKGPYWGGVVRESERG